MANFPQDSNFLNIFERGLQDERGVSTFEQYILMPSFTFN